MIDARELGVVIDARFAAENVASAHRHVEGKHTLGKVLLDFTDAAMIT